MTTLMIQPIPYQGSKRNLAKFILPYFPKGVRHLYEPFAGSAAITIAAAYYNKANYFFTNDLNAPLMALWDRIINHPDTLAEEYTLLWNQQLENPKEFFSKIRDRFNQTHQPSDFLYLMARCVKGSIRYNNLGEFNQSADNRRLGKNPVTMRKDIQMVSALLNGRITITAKDFREATQSATSQDLIYMDPPYQGTCTGKDNRYYSGIVFDELVSFLDDLNSKNIPWILSYDGSTGEKTYGKDLPPDLNAYHLKINAGRSSQDTLNGGDAITVESVYLSRRLISNLQVNEQEIRRIIRRDKQLSFLEEFND